MSTPLTDRQAQVLRHIAEHIVQHQRPPTRKGICRHFGWSSGNAAEQMVQVLERKGYIALDEAGEGGQGARYPRVLRWPDGVLPPVQAMDHVSPPSPRERGHSSTDRSESMSRTRKYAITSEAAIRALVAQGFDTKQIAEKLNVHPAALSVVRCMLGIAIPAKKTGVVVGAWWVPAIAAGATVDTIAKAEGKSYPCIHAVLKKAGLPTTQKGAAEYMAGFNKTLPVAVDAPAAPAEVAPLALAA